MTAAKRKRSGAAASSTGPVAATIEIAEQPKRKARKISTNPDKNPSILDAPEALRASPDSDLNDKITPGNIKTEEESSLSELSDVPDPAAKTKAKRGGAAKTEATNGTRAIKKPDQDTYEDPEAEDGVEATEEEVKQAISRPPPVHSAYLPLPWKGRLGYACLNTYLRLSNPPVFCSRTCRIASILEHRHPLKDPTQPEHATKNRPDRDQPADVARGQDYLRQVCLANVRDLPKMIRWNQKYGIRFMRLSSEMFPFASHEEYGYGLAPFASEALAEAGKVIAELGHRVTTHPGQFTQLGSPRKSVIDNAIRDLNYHDEMLSLLQLPDQQDRDAVMILHMGGVFGDKEAAIARFRENYAKLSPSVKKRLVLENDDVSYNVHELLPICEELNIPLVLDFHHHNILFDATEVREGTADVVPLFPRILATWARKAITPKMHYSEPTPEAITPRQRRKHNPRVSTLPPCPDTMDLMIEAKDKEQAVFQLMRDFKLPGWDGINDVIPYVREDDNKAVLAAMSKNSKKKEQQESEGFVMLDDQLVGMGGPQNRVFWPVGMEEWLRPRKRTVKTKTASSLTRKPMDIAERKRELAASAAAAAAATETDSVSAASVADYESDVNATPATIKAKRALRLRDERNKAAAAAAAAANQVVAVPASKCTDPRPVAPAARRRRNKAPTPDHQEDEEAEDAEQLPSTGQDIGRKSESEKKERVAKQCARASKKNQSSGPS